MTEYQFRFPSDAPEMTFGALAARLREHWFPFASGERYAKIGTTVTLRWHDRAQAAVQVRLYGTCIAILDERSVRFPDDDPHMATTAWIARIVRDNGLGNTVWRVRRRKADGPGPEGTRGQAGLLVIDGDRDAPVHGRTWAITTTTERIAS